MTRTLHPGDADDLPPVHGQAHVSEGPPRREVTRLENTSAGTAPLGARAGRRGPSLARHQPNELLAVDLPAVEGPHVASVAQHCDAVRDAQHLAEAVAHVDDRLALVAQGLQASQQVLGVVLRDGGRRLVEEQYTPKVGERPCDLAYAQLRDAQRRGSPVHVKRRAGTSQRGGCPIALGLSKPQTRREWRLEPKRRVPRGAQTANHMHLLGHETDAARARVARIAKRHLFAANPNRAPIGPYEAGQHAQQRGLPSPVFTDDRMDLSGSGREAHAVERLDASETLGDALELDRSGQRHVTP